MKYRGKLNKFSTLYSFCRRLTKQDWVSISNLKRKKNFKNNVPFNHMGYCWLYHLTPLEPFYVSLLRWWCIVWKRNQPKRVAGKMSYIRIGYNNGKRIGIEEWEWMSTVCHSSITCYKVTILSPFVKQNVLNLLWSVIAWKAKTTTPKTEKDKMMENVSISVEYTHKQCTDWRTHFEHSNGTVLAKYKHQERKFCLSHERYKRRIRSMKTDHDI